MEDRGPDQGLRYELAAVLGAPGALARFVGLVPDARVVPLAVTEVAMLPVTVDLAATVTPAPVERRHALLTGPESGFSVLRPGLVAVIEAVSVDCALAYVEADYLGREGTQAAAIWRRGLLVAGPLLLGRRERFVGDAAPVNVALRALGVPALGRSDEFTVAGLGRHRRTANWS